MTSDRTLLITGATGTVSSALIDALQEIGALQESDCRLRALIRDESRADALRRRGIHPVLGDLDDPRSLPPAFDGVHDLWLLTPNDPQAPAQSSNAVWAARQAGVERVVRLSAIRAGSDAPTRSGRLHALSDRELERSGMGWTILRPHWFMQNLFQETGDIATEGVLRLQMADARLGMVDVRDVAAVAARVLTDEPNRHHGRIYTPTGPSSLSFAQVAEEFTRISDRPVRYAPVADEEVERRLRGFGVPEWIVGMLTEYAQAYRSGWGDFTTTDVRDVTEQPPRGIADFLRDHVGMFAPE